MSHLTNGQKNTLLAAIKADPTAGVLRSQGNVTGLWSWLNSAKSPTALAWSVQADTLLVEEAPAYTTFDSLSQGKRDSWVLFLRNPRNFGRNKVRGWVVDVWGTATTGSNSESILLAATENATNAQVILGGTVKQTGVVSALDRTYAENIDYEDVQWFCQQP